MTQKEPADSPLATRIADAALNLSLNRIARQTLDRLRWSALDFIGCVIAGSRLHDVGPALALARPGKVVVPGFDTGFDLTGSALVMGTAGTLLQVHDVYLPGHIHSSSPVLPAAWAMWKQQGGPVEKFLEAFLAGCETLNRLSATTYPQQQRAGSTPTATLGAIGAAVAAGRMAGLDRDAMARAIGNAAMLAPLTPFQALREHGSAVPMHSGAAARAGVEAVLLAQAGWSAGRQVLEGSGGFPGWLAIIQGDPSVLAPESWDGSSVDQMIWKLLPGCFASLPAVEAALSLPQIEIGQIASVEIQMPAAPMTLVGEGPLSTTPELYDCLMSVRWSVAQVLVRGGYGLGVATEPPHESVAPLLDLVTVRYAKELDAFLPELVAANVVVTLKDGRTHVSSLRRAAAVDPSGAIPRAWINHPDDAMLSRKFKTLTVHRKNEAGQLQAMLMPGLA